MIYKRKGGGTGWSPCVYVGCFLRVALFQHKGFSPPGSDYYLFNNVRVFGGCCKACRSHTRSSSFWLLNIWFTFSENTRAFTPQFPHAFIYLFFLNLSRWLLVWRGLVWRRRESVSVVPAAVHAAQWGPPLFPSGGMLCQVSRRAFSTCLYEPIIPLKEPLCTMCQLVYCASLLNLRVFFFFSCFISVYLVLFTLKWNCSCYTVWPALAQGSTKYWLPN